MLGGKAKLSPLANNDFSTSLSLNDEKLIITLL